MNTRCPLHMVIYQCVLATIQVLQVYKELCWAQQHLWQSFVFIFNSFNLYSAKLLSWNVLILLFNLFVSYFKHLFGLYKLSYNKNIALQKFVAKKTSSPGWIKSCNYAVMYSICCVDMDELHIAHWVIIDFSLFIIFKY